VLKNRMKVLGEQTDVPGELATILQSRNINFMRKKTNFFTGAFPKGIPMGSPVVNFLCV